jgi:hypothetical protein
MKNSILSFLGTILILSISSGLFSQSTALNREFGLTVGGFTNFPCNKHYLDDNIKVISLAPYIIVGKHEFYAGIIYPLRAYGLFNGIKLNSRPGALAGYKFYIFNKAGRENMYVNYSFQFLRFKGPYNTGPIPYTFIEKDYYMNNVFSLGYMVYFDSQQRFGMYYSLGYVISQGGYVEYTKIINPTTHIPWSTEFILNNINTNVGFSFKLKSFDKKTPKAN